jgi:hypothetical protein
MTKGKKKDPLIQGGEVTEGTEQKETVQKMIRPIYTHPIKGKTVAGLVFLHCCASSVPSKRVEWCDGEERI